MPNHNVSTSEDRAELRADAKQLTRPPYSFKDLHKIIDMAQVALPLALDRIEELEARVKDQKAGAKINCQGIERLKKENEKLKNVIREQNKDQIRLLNETGKGGWT